MSIFKDEGSKKIIPIDIFNYCLIDKKTKKEITNLFPSRNDGIYYLNKFINFLSKYHKISIQEYIEKYFNEKWPLCPISKEPVGYKTTGIGLILSKFKRGKIDKNNSTAFRKACEKLSQERLGKNNPMYGKKAWNTGLKKETDERVAIVAKKRTDKKMSQDSKNKMKEARERHPLKARHTTKHSDESKEKMRKATINRWQIGEFSFKITSIEKKVDQWLKNNCINYVFQHGIGGFVADFVCLDEKIIIECQGDFFHCNPCFEKYAEPKYDIQKRNLYRDKIKKQKYKDLGWKLIELWECDINSGEFKNILRCELKK